MHCRFQLFVSNGKSLQRHFRSSNVIMSAIRLRVRTKINWQIFSVEAPAWQGAKVQEYQAYSKFSQRSQVGCIGAKNVKLFLREPFV